MNKVTALMRTVAAALGADVILAGGAVRDIVHKRCPKDYDLLVLKDVSCESYEEEALFARETVLAAGGTNAEIFCTYRTAHDCRIAYVVKFQLDGMDFDLIQHNTGYQTPREQVCNFDTNLNMMWMDAHGAVTIEPEAEAVLNGDTPVTALAACDGLRADRLSYLRTKYPGYTFDFETVITPEVY